MSYLETLLGRKLVSDAYRSVPTLNDLPAPMLEEAVKLAHVSRPMAVSYLEYHVAESYAATDFCDEVLLGGAPVGAWGKRDLICYREVSIETLLEQPVAQMIAVLDAVDGDRWFRAPLVAEWSYSDGGSAPGVLVHSASYLWKGPSGTQSIVVTNGFEKIADSELVVAFRRWIAWRIAWHAENYLAGDHVTVEGLLTFLQHEAASLSGDAIVALHALVREVTSLRLAGTAPLGYGAPTDWYQ